VILLAALAFCPRVSAQFQNPIQAAKDAYNKAKQQARQQKQQGQQQGQQGQQQNAPQPAAQPANSPNQPAAGQPGAAGQPAPSAASGGDAVPFSPDSGATTGGNATAGSAAAFASNAPPDFSKLPDIGGTVRVGRHPIRPGRHC
jgi:hypothetical protein